MVRSFHYVAYKAFLNTGQVAREDIPNLLPFARIWARYMSSFFLNAYLEKIENSSLIPAAKQDRNLMLRIYILEGALQDLNYELNNRPDYVVVPLGLIRTIMERAKV
jgi:maltose alpha-D-glucosyltransferase/alpha-amylase